MSCGCQSRGGCSCPVYYPPVYKSLGALTPDQAADTIFPQSSVRSTAGFNQHVRDCIVQAAGSGQFSCFQQSGCSGVSAGGNISLIKTSAGLALTGTTVGLTATGAVAAAALSPFTLGISALIGLFPIIFQHHAQAVAQEQRVLCASVPAANNTLQVIQNAVNSGQIDPAHGISALSSLLSDFTNTVSSIMKNNSSQCNAACVWVKELTAIVAELTSQYQDLGTQQQAAASAAAAAAAATATRPNVTSVTGASAASTTSPAGTTSSYANFGTPAPAAPAAMPSWLPIAVIAGAAFLFM